MATLEETLRENILIGAIERATTGVISYPHGDGTVTLERTADLLKALQMLGGVLVPTSAQSATTYAEVVT